jgi:apolipoprotein N-acyltransferase
MAIVIAIFVFGALKMSSRSPEQETVKTAAIVLIPEDGKLVPPDHFWKDKSVFPFEETMARIERLTQTAASNGAKIVSFSEFAILIHEEDVERVRAEYQRMAQEHNVYLSANYAYYGTEGKGENMHLLIDPQGNILLDYAKRYLYGMGDAGETGIYRKGPEVIQSVETPYGKIAVSLCRDLEMVDYMRQAAKADVDIMLSPANQVTKDLVVHSNYMRTIEYGFSVVRPAFNGISVAVDYHGRILNQMDSDETADGIMYADIPTRGIKTLYTIIGDAFGWLCVLGFGALIVMSIIESRVQQKHHSLVVELE